jgi:thioredoxin reductase
MARISPRVAVLGAGPIGLEAAALARRQGWAVAVYERGRVGENLERWGFLRLFSPFGMNSTPWGREIVRTSHRTHDLPGDNDLITGREHVAAYLTPLATSPLLAECVKADQTVVGVSRAGLFKSEGTAEKRAGVPFRLLLRDSKGNETSAEADVVLDCTGTFGNPRNLGDGGLPAAGELVARPQIAVGVEDILGGQKAKYAGKTVLLVGAGYTAATHVSLLAELAQTATETWVVWLARGPRSQPLIRIANDPLRERDRIATRANALATRGDGNGEFHPSAVVERIVTLGPDKGFQVTARIGGKLRAWDVDRLIGSVGYRPDTSIYGELQVSECPVTEGPAAMGAALARQVGADLMSFTSCGPTSLKTGEPNFHVLGAKSYGRNPHFLLKTGFEQVRDAISLIAGKPISEAGL